MQVSCPGCKIKREALSMRSRYVHGAVGYMLDYFCEVCKEWFSTNQWINLTEYTANEIESELDFF